MTGILRTFDIQIAKLTYGGDALGRVPDSQGEARGRAVFVPFALPGERVRVRLVEEKRGYARAELLEVLEPSPHRIAPKCAHFGSCGGCHYQNLPYEIQLQEKAEILRDQLRRIGKIEAPPVQPMVASPDPWNYRNHLRFHLTADGKLGFVGARGENIVPIEECYLPEKVIDDFWPQLDFEAGIPLERVSFRASSTEDLMLVLESKGLEAPELELKAGISVVHLSGEDALVMAGDDHLLTQVQDRSFRVTAGSFFQVHTSMAERMVAHLLDHLPLPASSILDVYCGVGLFSAFLASDCDRLLGVESSPAACEDFAINLDEFDHVELYEGTAAHVIPHLEGKQDIVVVDPPRAGLHRRALDGIVRLNPDVLAYVSCDPSTLARDISRLIRGGYRLVKVTPFDLFPQTYHIESISLLMR